MYCRGSWDDCSLFSTASSSQTCKAASVNLSNCSFKKKCHLSAQACKKPCVCLFASQRIWFPSRCSNTSNVESESSGKIRWPLMLNGVSYMLPSSDSCNFLQSALFRLSENKTLRIVTAGLGFSLIKVYSMTVHAMSISAARNKGGIMSVRDLRFKPKTH